METKAKIHVLVTGGCGYIGSHTCIELLQNPNYEVYVIDNLSNSTYEPLKRIQEITKRSIYFEKVDLRDELSLETLFSKFSFDVVIHFAGLKAVGESVSFPLLYYHNNLVGTLTLMKVMEHHQINNLIFSSSACVYGYPISNPITENMDSCHPTNPYGQTKTMIEQIMIDQAKAVPNLKVILLRYFNPIGSHCSHKIGEDPKQPNNIMPYILHVASHRKDKLYIFGNDYDTVDGTGARDYIHVVDLAQGHIAALKYALTSKMAPGSHKIYNLGTGNYYSVLQLVDTFQKSTGQTIPYEFAKRREGDVNIIYADPSKAENELEWKATHTLSQMCYDSYQWAINNPNGYQTTDH